MTTVLQSNRSTAAPAPGATRWPGLILALVLAAAAYWLGGLFPVVGGPVIGIMLGMAAGATGLVTPVFKPGTSFASKQVLQMAIVLLGAGLSLSQIIQTGAESLAVMLISLFACLGAAWFFGRLFQTPANLTALIGVGTAICGASAIAAVAPVIEAEEKEVAYAISTIFAFNVAAVVLFPAAGHFMGMDQQSFGLWAGTAINDTSSVVAAAFSFGPEAGAYATVVKLARATMIIPIALGFAAWRAVHLRQQGAAGKAVSVKRLIPWFILYFLAAALANTLGWLPTPVPAYATAAGKFLIIAALAAVGLNADFRSMARTGMKPLLLGLTLWIVVAVSSLIVQRMNGL